MNVEKRWEHVSELVHVFWMIELTRDIKVASIRMKQTVMDVTFGILNIVLLQLSRCLKIQMERNLVFYHLVTLVLLRKRFQKLPSNWMWLMLVNVKLKSVTSIIPQPFLIGAMSVLLAIMPSTRQRKNHGCFVENLRQNDVKDRSIRFVFDVQVTLICVSVVVNGDILMLRTQKNVSNCLVRNENLPSCKIVKAMNHPVSKCKISAINNMDLRLKMLILL